MDTIGSRLAALRGISGLSAAELGTLARLQSPAHVRLIERGERSGVAATTATALARVLGTSAEYLVDGEGAPPAEADVRAAVERARLAAQPAAAEEPRPSQPAAA